MLALVEVLLNHINDSLSYIRRLDFSLAAKEGKHSASGKKGIRSHGAFALSRYYKYLNILKKYSYQGIILVVMVHRQSFVRHLQTQHYVHY